MIKTKSKHYFHSMTGTSISLYSITNPLPLRLLLLLVTATILPLTNSLSSSPTNTRPPPPNIPTVKSTLLKNTFPITTTQTNNNPTTTTPNNKNNPQTLATFLSPLLSAGYPPAVRSHLSSKNNNNNTPPKPILLYLPGFDGTILSPFLQFPELSTIFDVRAMKVPMEDRSTFLDLRRVVVDYLERVVVVEEQRNDGGTTTTATREVYLMGESFGGILACDIISHVPSITGLVLINPATSYPRSALCRLSPTVLSAPPLLYPLRLLSTLVPLFLDDYQMPQLGLILSSRALPSVIDSMEREAYMGRMAFSLPRELKFMPRETLEWRLDRWLRMGCDEVGVETLRGLTNAAGRVLVVVGEDDETLPSVDEGERIRSLLGGEERCVVTVVPGAGHASTCGSRVDLAAEMRRVFPALRREGEEEARVEMKVEAREGKGAFYGMEGRYDGSTTVGLSPLRYWDEDLYLKCDE